jgi:predicted nucleic acid-binding protein
MPPHVVVLDASVGVKWIREEPGTTRAEELLTSHMRGEVRIAVPVHFLHEVMSVAVREGGAELAGEVWDSLEQARLTVVTLDSTLARAGIGQCRALGCTFYDALAPGLAALLDAPLYSADERAHAAFPGVRMVGM